MSTPAPLRIFRDPTRRDVEELCRERGGKLVVCPATNDKDARSYYKVSIVNDVEVSMWLGSARKGERPNWRAMLQKLGSDWA